MSANPFFIQRTGSDDASLLSCHGFWRPLTIECGARDDGGAAASGGRVDLLYAFE